MSKSPGTPLTEKKGKYGATDKLLEKHVKRIQELSRDLNATDIQKRYAIACEVKAIHDANGETGMKDAAKRLVRWSSKTLYEYKAVAEAWDRAVFRRMSAEAAPSGNRLLWSDYVGLTYVKNPSERERVRKQALAENRSVKNLKSRKPKCRRRAEDAVRADNSDGAAVSSTPLPSALAKLLNDAPALEDTLKTVMILLERATPEDATSAGFLQLCAAVADQLLEAGRCIDEGVPMLRRFTGVSPDAPAPGLRKAGAIPAGRNDSSDGEAAAG